MHELIQSEIQSDIISEKKFVTSVTCVRKCSVSVPFRSVKYTTYSLTYYEGIAVFTKALIMKQCTVLRVLGLWRMLCGTTVGWFSSY